MKISEIIPILQEALKDHGDIEVVCWEEDLETHYHLHYVEAAEFSAVPNGTDVFAVVIASSDDIF